jgi:hypothetical protein
VDSLYDPLVFIVFRLLANVMNPFLFITEVILKTCISACYFPGGNLVWISVVIEVSHDLVESWHARYFLLLIMILLEDFAHSSWIRARLVTVWSGTISEALFN